MPSFLTILIGALRAAVSALRFAASALSASPGASYTSRRGRPDPRLALSASAQIEEFARRRDHRNVEGGAKISAPAAKIFRGRPLRRR